MVTRLLFSLLLLLLIACNNNSKSANRRAPSTAVSATVAVPAAPSQQTAEPTAVPVTVTRSPEATAPIATVPTKAEIAELLVEQIPLTEPVSSANAEISGLAWYQDWLVLLPQYPSFAGGSNPVLYALKKEEILAFLDGSASGPLEPFPINLQDAGLPRLISGYEGYEAIAFSDARAYLTIESRAADGMLGYVVSGEVVPEVPAIRIDGETLQPIQPQASLSNKSDESIFIAGEQIITVYEVNDSELNPNPVVHVFDQSLEPSGVLPLSPIPYRITDATALDEADRFWAINYFFPGEPELATGFDPIAEEFGLGPTHRLLPGVERLVQFQYSPDGITLTGRPPIYLELLPLGLRNWEGLVRLDDRGFLIVTDKYPTTVLAFISDPDP